MPNINSMKESKFLKRTDVGAGKLLTINGCHQENVAMQGEPPEMKWILTFAEEKKGMVLNTTNQELIARALGSDETDDWLSRKIVVYDDPNVSMGGRLVGGIRCRAPKTQAGAQAPAAAQPSATRNPPPAAAASEGDDSLPF